MESLPGLVILVVLLLLGWIVHRWKRRRLQQYGKGAQQSRASSTAASIDSYFEVEAVSTFSPSWHNETNSWPVRASGSSTVKRAFCPSHASLSETVIATYEGPGLPELTLQEHCGDASSVVLTRVDGAGRVAMLYLSGPEVNACKAFGDWPDLPGSLHFAILPRVLDRARKDLPEGYNPLPKIVTAKIKLELYGTAR